MSEGRQWPDASGLGKWMVAGGDGDAVAGCVLDEVHGGVCGAHDVLRSESVLGVGGDAEAGGDGEAQVGVDEEDLIAEALAHLLGEVGGLGLGGVRRQEYEFIAAVAEGDISGTREAEHAGADLGEEAAADLVTVAVIDGFEVVEIEEDEAEVSAGASSSKDLFLKHLLEAALVVEAGAVVGDGEGLDFFDGAGIFNGDGGVVAEDVEERDGVLGHGLKAAVEELDDAESALPGKQGHADGGAELESARVGLVESSVLLDVRHDEAFAMLGDPSRHAFADGHAQVA